MLRSPDVRLGDVRSEIVAAKAGFERSFAFPGRGVFGFVLEGRWSLAIADEWREISAGTAVGFEDGRPHRWRTAAGGRLLISSIPREMGVLQSLPDRTIIVPHDARPHADILRHAVDLHCTTFESGEGPDDQSIIRRCAEICLIELVRYVRDGMVNSGAVPKGVVHDEYLLRAWAAYYADPGRKWTVQSLADAAGLGRTAFSERFRKVFGTSPLHTLTRLRLEQAEDMLLHSHAPLIEIAFRAGYNSEAAFVRAFQRQYGAPPGKFRHDNR